MKKVRFFIAALALMMASSASARDIRVVEISTGNGMRSSYDSSIQSILKSLSGVSKVVSDVANLVLTVTYDADEIGVDDIVSHINKKEPRFEAKQKGEPKTKKWIKAEKKQKKAEQRVDDARKEANQRDEQRKQPEGTFGSKTQPSGSRR